MATLNTSKLRQALELHAELSDKNLARKHPHVGKWFEKRGLHPKQIRHHAAKLVSSGALAGAMFLANPLASQLSSNTSHQAAASKEQLQELFGKNLRALLPSEVRP